MDINEAIPYAWPFGWDSENMSREAPVVNRLLKAIIEKNVNEMNDLFSKGATIKGIDEATFERALFHMLGDYPVIKCLVEHGFIGAYGDYEYCQTCLEPAGYFWGILARAWVIGNMDVFKLLAQNGFGDMSICSNGEGYYGEELIIKRNDVQAAIILMENGYPRKEFLCERYMNRYPNSEVLGYLQLHPLIPRKTIMLDDFKFREIPLPRLEEPGFFNRKKVRQRNKILLQDYEDRVIAQERFKRELGIEKWNEIVNKKEESDNVLSMAMKEILDF